MCTVPSVMAANTQIFNDTIEDHAIYVETGNGLGNDYDNNVAGIASGCGDVLVPNVWQVSSIFGGASWVTDYRVQYDKQYANSWNDSDADITTDKVIRLKSLSVDGSTQAAVNLIADVSGIGENFVYSADLRPYFEGECTPVMGIRLVDPTSESNYYELAMFNYTGVANTKEDTMVSAPRFTKVQGATDINTPAIAAEGSEPATWIYTEYGDTAAASGLYPSDPLPHHTEWFTLTLGRNGNTFTWSVTEKSSGEVVWSDSWTDASPLFDGYAQLQLFEYGGNSGSTLINNVTCKKNVQNNAITAKAVDAVAGEETATMRFITEATTVNGTVSEFGTYIIPLSIFEDESGLDTAVVAKYEQAIEAGATYAVDLTGIPAANYTTPIFARSYMIVDDNTVTCDFAAANVAAIVAE